MTFVHTEFVTHKCTAKILVPGNNQSHLQVDEYTLLQNAAGPEIVQYPALAA